MQPQLRIARVVLMVLTGTALIIASWFMLRHLGYGPAEWMGVVGVVAAHCAAIYVIWLATAQFHREINRQVACDLFSHSGLSQMVDGAYPRALPPDNDDETMPAGSILFAVLGAFILPWVLKMIFIPAGGRLSFMGMDANSLIRQYLTDRNTRGAGRCMPLSLHTIWLVPVSLLLAGFIIWTLCIPGGASLRQYELPVVQWGQLIIAGTLVLTALLWNSFQTALVKTVLDRLEREETTKP